MKKLLILTLIFLCGCTQVDQTTYKATEFIFTTPVTITILENGSEEILNESFNLLRELDKKFSKTNEESELYKLNHANGEKTEVSDELLEVLQTSVYYSSLSDGLFDVTISPLVSLWGFGEEVAFVPSDTDILDALSLVNYENIEIDGNFVTLHNGATVDLGGIAKGYIALKTDEFLREQGVTKAIIDIGGNVVVIGAKNNKENFVIGVKKPYSDSEIIHTIETHDKAIVSSGPYERYFEQDGKEYHHIINPKTGYPAESDLLSVTIISEDPMLADAISTTCFILGLDNAKILIEGLDNVEAVFITANYEVIEIN